MSPAIQKIIDTCKKSQSDCDQILKVAEPLQKEWLSSAEFARLEGLQTKTVSNYCRSGILRNIRRRNGHYEIHKSELKDERKGISTIRP